MLTEIDRDFYCSDTEDLCSMLLAYRSERCEESRCKNHHRRHPTPEQYQEEYGEEYADHRPVWFWYDYGWQLMSYKEAWNTKFGSDGLLIPRDQRFIVCVCSPFDSPDKDWRPV